jgi:diaminopimelate decarboxylase
MSNANRPNNLNEFAILRYEGQNHRCNSLKEAKEAWKKLTPDQQVHASIVANGTMYNQAEIDQL